MSAIEYNVYTFSNYDSSDPTSGTDSNQWAVLQTSLPVYLTSLEIIFGLTGISNPTQPITFGSTGPPDAVAVGYYPVGTTPNGILLDGLGTNFLFAGQLGLPPQSQFMVQYSPANTAVSTAAAWSVFYGFRGYWFIPGDSIVYFMWEVLATPAWPTPGGATQANLYIRLGSVGYSN